MEGSLSGSRGLGGGEQPNWRTEKASPEARAAARAGIEALGRAKAAYDRALEEANGDPARLKAATDVFAGVRQGIADAVVQATRSAAVGPGGAGLASPRVPEKVGKATVRPGATVWELSQRTGVPVERILEFNAQAGQPIDPARLQVGQQILVPLGAEDVTFRPRSAEEVQGMVDQAALEKRLASISPPTFHSGEGPSPLDVVPASLDPVQKERGLAAVRNDRALIAEDEKSSRFNLASPSTWVDTKAEEARYAAREAFSQAVNRYEGLLNDPAASREALRAAERDKLRALNAYNAARGVTDEAAAAASYLTPLTELAEKGQDALHDVNRGVRTAMADRLTMAGVPSVLVGAATLPSHVFDSVVDFDAGVAKGVVQLADGLAGTVAHPVQAAQGVGGLIDRAAQATPQGRALELLFETAYGKYDTPQELLAAYQGRTNPLSVAKAQVELAADIGRGMFAESIRLARAGKYAEAAGTALGQNVDMLFGAGMVGRGDKLRAAVEAAEEAGTAGRAASAAGHAAEAGRAADAAGDATRGLGRGSGAEVRSAADATADTRRDAAAASAGAERTQVAEAADILNPKNTASPRVLESSGADVTRPDRIVGSARTSRAFSTSTRPSIAEAEAYKEALRRGEIGLQRPAHANAPGTDFLTAVRDRITGQYRIVVTDVKSSIRGEFPPARTTLSAEWLRELQDAIAPGRLDLGNPALEAQIRAAVASERISLRRITVDYSAAGQGAIRGF